MRGSSLRTKLLVVILTAFAVTMFTVVLVVDRYQCRLIDEGHTQVYAEKVRSVQGWLEFRHQLLLATGQVSLYEGEFIESTSDFVRRVYFSELGRDIELFVVDRDGRSIIHSAPEDSAAEETAVVVRFGKTSGEFDYRTQAGVPRWCRYAAVSGWPWIVGYSISHTAKYENAARTRWFLTMTMVLMAAIALFVVAMLVNRFTKPVLELTSVARGIAAGDLHQAIDVTATDEVGVLAASFVKMQDAVAEQIERLSDEVEQRKVIEIALEAQQEHLEDCIRLRTREAAEMHSELLDASRRAGMAEVATGVLHNLGNALTSVNIAASIIRQKLDVSQVSLLRDVAGRLEASQNDIEDFLSHDAEGQAIPLILVKLARVLDQEHVDLVNTIGVLDSAIDHMKDVVAAQQNASRPSGVKRIMSLDGLIKSTLKLWHESGKRGERIELVRDWKHDTSVRVDSGRVMQILLNLLNNARDAVAAGDRTDGRIKIGVEGVDSWVHISVEDNGVGIESGLLVKVFAHGFSTKAEGFGFGLHYCANAAIEMGGRLVVESDGPGTGARFTLVLPHEEELVPEPQRGR